jgi:transcriptional regulator of acetoin/glycerol metabolism
MLSWVYERLGEHLKAERHSEAAVHYCRWEVEDRKIEADAWNTLGVIHKNTDLWEYAERDLRTALAACDGNKSRAAKMLGINRKTLWRKIRLLDEQPE